MEVTGRTGDQNINFDFVIANFQKRLTLYLRLSFYRRPQLRRLARVRALGGRRVWAVYDPSA